MQKMHTHTQTRTHTHTHTHTVQSDRGERVMLLNYVISCDLQLHQRFCLAWFTSHWNGVDHRLFKYSNSAWCDKRSPTPLPTPPPAPSPGWNLSSSEGPEQPAKGAKDETESAQPQGFYLIPANWVSQGKYNTALLIFIIFSLLTRPGQDRFAVHICLQVPKKEFKRIIVYSLDSLVILLSL